MTLQTERFKRDVLDRLASFGVRPERVNLQYVDDLQDYEIIIDQSDLSQEQVERIVEDMRGCGVLEFKDQLSAEMQRQAETRAYRSSRRRQAFEMPGLPKFNPKKMSLAEFARELEAYCGVEPGGVLEARGEYMLTIRGAPLIGSFQDHARVLEAASIALVDHEGIFVGVAGGT